MADSFDDQSFSTSAFDTDSFAFSTPVGFCSFDDQSFLKDAAFDSNSFLFCAVPIPPPVQVLEWGGGGPMEIEDTELITRLSDEDFEIVKVLTEFLSRNA